ncbi:hypothetical protein E4U43_001784 [Claviceps pusilla]|uniref:RecQ mediated genome instability protein 1 N-terminal domain-containing protein n=1 Tax=Claviceps pusilla TaxID=123648 RepID=A0A9P7NHY0_9HYPO|nr:hypothetical protein E4U43_001784 [Claviceps pusilla]
MDPTSRLRNQIISQNLPCPSSSLLASLTSTRSPPPPLPSLVATAKARLLACDLTTSDLVDSSQLSSFPAEILRSPSPQELSLPQDIFVQVLDIENLSSSRWEQIEELEAIERGERTRGRQIIRVTGEADGDGEGDGDGTQSNGSRDAASAVSGRPSVAALGPGRNATHRLVVQDPSGQRVYAVELQRMPEIRVATTSIGCKMLLRAGSIVARGTVLLTPETCLILDGKIEPWHDAWVVSRMARLKEAVGAGTNGAAPTSR